MQEFIESIRKISYIADSGERPRLPEWSVCAASIGYWTQKAIEPRSRILGFLVGPRRDYLGMFAALGAMIASGEDYQSTFSWARFVNCSTKTVVHWKDSGKTFSGHILGAEDFDGCTMMRVEVTKSSRKSDLGSQMLFSQSRFEQCSFSIERHRSVRRTSRQTELLRLISRAVKPAWFDDGGSAVQYLGSVSRFRSLASSTGLTLGDASELATVADLLMPERVNANVVSKLKVDPPGTPAQNGDSLIIQDGARAYAPDSSSNILFVLDREELKDEIKEDLLSVEETFADTSMLLEGLGGRVSGLEFCAFSQELED